MSSDIVRDVGCQKWQFIYLKVTFSTQYLGYVALRCLDETNPSQLFIKKVDLEKRWTPRHPPPRHSALLQLGLAATLLHSRFASDRFCETATHSIALLHHAALCARPTNFAQKILMVLKHPYESPEVPYTSKSQNPLLQIF